ncbi:MAG: serine/threonine-protein kinase [Polyangiaceae bacterium]
MSLQPGTEVTPNVRLVSHLADGAMGAVWLAEHMTLNTKVAVKFISDRLDPEEAEVFERFVREASTAAQIKSSHVVQTFDQGVMRDGTPYIVMEYLEGEELGDKLSREKQLDLAEVVLIVSHTAKALQSAHKIGVIHRDIKPDNLFLSTRDDELHVKVFDFGIAKIRHPKLHDVTEVDLTAQLSDAAKMGLTNDGVMLGTPEYMSPEAVLSASHVDHHADLWALAVCAYVCLTGELPFKGKDVGELCVNLLEAKFTKATMLRPSLPPEIDAFFDKALARNLEDRFQSARELASGLAKALASDVDPFVGSGAWADARHSLGGSPSGSLSLEAEEGLSFKADSISGAAADADLLMPRRRLSPSVVGGAVVAVLFLGAAVAIFMNGGPGDPNDRAEAGPGASSVASPLPELTMPPSPLPQASSSASAGRDGSGEGEPPAEAPSAANGSRDKPAVPVRPFRPPPKPAPKDPGF